MEDNIIHIDTEKFSEEERESMERWHFWRNSNREFSRIQEVCKNFRFRRFLSCMRQVSGALSHRGSPPFTPAIARSSLQVSLDSMFPELPQVPLVFCSQASLMPRHEGTQKPTQRSCTRCREVLTTPMGQHVSDGGGEWCIHVPFFHLLVGLFWSTVFRYHQLAQALVMQLENLFLYQHSLLLYYAPLPLANSLFLFPGITWWVELLNQRQELPKARRLVIWKKQTPIDLNPSKFGFVIHRSS